MKSEACREVHMLSDWMQILLHEGSDQQKSTARYWEHLSQAAHSTDFLWQQIMLKLPSIRKQEETYNSVTILGGVTIPGNLTRILENGPRPCYEPPSSRCRLLGVIQELSEKVTQRDKERIIGDGAECVCNVSEGTILKPPIKRVANFLKDNYLTILELVKEGSFVVMPKGMFERKAIDAVAKNFITHDAKKQKCAAVKLLENFKLPQLSKALQDEKSESL